MSFNIGAMMEQAKARVDTVSGESWYPGFAAARDGGNPDTVIQWVNNELVPGIAAGKYQDYQGDTDGDIVGSTVASMQSARARRSIFGTGFSISQSDSKHLGEAAKGVAIAGLAVGAAYTGYAALGEIGATTVGENAVAVGAGEGAVSAESANAAFSNWTAPLGGGEGAVSGEAANAAFSNWSATQGGATLPAWTDKAIALGSRLFFGSPKSASDSMQADTAQHVAYRPGLGLSNTTPQQAANASGMMQLFTLGIALFGFIILFRLLRR